MNAEQVKGLMEAYSKVYETPEVSEEIVEEMADVIIRLLDLYAAMMNGGFIEHSLDEQMNKKMEINKYGYIQNGQSQPLRTHGIK